ncbi:MAG: hypothetical protein M1820_010728 [Bogoriella megaspora]|nr:MAG: hypothetical protein M1820_010728 [Bogoriella megaspora]
MSLYAPNNDAIPIAPWSTALLSQRDVSNQIPINYLTNPAVSLTAACFSQGLYEDDIAGTCISNLLAIGFRRLIVDVYWDVSRHVWSLCPVQVPDENGASSPLPSSATTSSSRASLSSAQLTTSTTGSDSSQTTSTRGKRQGSSPSSGGTLSVSLGPSSESSRSSTSALTSTSSPTSTISIAPSASIIESASGPLFELGPYRCTSTIQLSFLTKLLAQYLDSTDTTIKAFIQHLEINLHAATTTSSPTEPAPSVNSSDLPAAGNLLTDVLLTNLSSYLYTPSMLFSDRANLNATWFSVLEEHRVDSNYFTSNNGTGGIHSTKDGWPASSYVEMERFHRMLVSFGSIDPQMYGYYSSLDDANVFAPGYLNQNRHVETSSTGQLTSGCFFDPDIPNLRQTNNSWALSSNLLLPKSSSPSDLSTLTPTISNLTTCGISPFLNTTLLNTPASSPSSLSSYSTLANAAIWSWAPNEPSTSPSTSPYYSTSSSPPTSSQFRCAAFNALSTPPGRWHVADCMGRHYAACRSNVNPYDWRISTYRGGYTEVNDNCPDGYVFAVPRTAMENAYLLNAIEVTRPDVMQTSGSGRLGNGDDEDGPSEGVVWVNFNSLGTQDCWVQGVNRTCPYVGGDDDGDHRRQVIVPTVAAVIVLCLGVLTVFVKCAANRQSSRRRRRRKGEGGWDYEGVPS